MIRVGAPSEAELKSRKEAFDDAVSATRAAVAEGIVPVMAVVYVGGRKIASSEDPFVRGMSQRTETEVIVRNAGTPGATVALTATPFRREMPMPCGSAWLAAS